MGSIFAVYKHRINRKNYFLGYLLLAIVLVGYARLADLAPTSPADPSAKLPVILFFFMLLVAIYYFFSLAIGRLHDFGKSGRFTFLMLVPLLSLLFFFILLFVPGEKKSNKYGAVQK